MKKSPAKKWLDLARCSVPNAQSPDDRDGSSTKPDSARFSGGVVFDIVGIPIALQPYQYPTRTAPNSLSVLVLKLRSDNSAQQLADWAAVRQPLRISKAGPGCNETWNLDELGLLLG